MYPNHWTLGPFVCRTSIESGLSKEDLHILNISWGGGFVREIRTSLDQSPDWSSEARFYLAKIHILDYLSEQIAAIDQAHSVDEFSWWVGGYHFYAEGSKSHWDIVVIPPYGDEPVALYVDYGEFQRLPCASVFRLKEQLQEWFTGITNTPIMEQK